MKHESLITLAYIAARTRKVKPGTSVFILPLRNPIIAAEQIATLYRISGGRSFWVSELAGESEFQYLGANFKRHGKIMDEQGTCLNLAQAVHMDG